MNSTCDSRKPLIFDEGVMKVKTLALRCPSCKKEVLMTEEFRHRPFCSQRCRDLDFGAWATESFKIAGNEVVDEGWSEEFSDGGYHEGE